jgi:hypothetical protein
VDARIQKLEILDDRMAELLRSKTVAERFAMIDKFWSFARQMVQARVVHEHPDWSVDLVRREVARRMSHGAV